MILNTLDSILNIYRMESINLGRQLIDSRLEGFLHGMDSIFNRYCFDLFRLSLNFFSKI